MIRNISSCPVRLASRSIGRGRPVLNSFKLSRAAPLRPVPSSHPRPSIVAPHKAVVLPIIPTRSFALKFNTTPEVNSIADVNKLTTRVESFFKTCRDVEMTEKAISDHYKDEWMRDYHYAFATLTDLATEISKRSSARDSRVRAAGFHVHVLKTRNAFKTASEEIEKLIRRLMRNLEEATEAISEASTLQAGVESALRFTQAEMEKLERRKSALEKENQDISQKLGDSGRATQRIQHIIWEMDRMPSSGWKRLVSDIADAMKAKRRSSWQNQLEQAWKERVRLGKEQDMLDSNMRQNLDELGSIKKAKTSLNTVNPNLRSRLTRLRTSDAQARKTQDKSITLKDLFSKMYGNYLVKILAQTALIEHESGTNELAKATLAVASLGLKSPESGSVYRYAEFIARSLSAIEKSAMDAESEDDPFDLGEASLEDKLAEFKRDLKATR